MRPPGAKHKIAPVIRAAFLRGLDLHEQKTRKTFSQLMQEEIEAKGILSVLDRVGRFVEREHAVDLTTGGESLVDVLSSLNGIISRAREDIDVEEEPGTLRH